ncbi:MAG: T9SS type A sorting domain-containing protein [Bacteroidetes bacterium]|nr:T9SS type A sorting domain-containing protein [Bacteroidota bacterium]
MKSITIILLVLLLNTILFSQTWLNLANKDWVYSIDEDQGFLWIGTSGGIVKLNKQTRETIIFDRANKRIPDNSVLTLNVRPDDSVWVGSRRSGIGIYDNNECVTYNSENSNIPHDQYNSSFAFDLADNNYIGSLGFVSKFKNGVFEIIKQMDPLVSFDCISDMKIDNFQNVWIASYQGLFKYDGNISERIGEVIGHANSIALDKNNNIWVGTDNYGLYYYSGVSWFCYNMVNSGLPSNNVGKIFFDSQGNLWIGSYDKLTCFSSTGIWSTYSCTSQNGNDFKIFTLFIDTNDHLWIGTRKNGLMLFENGIFKEVKFSQPSVFPSNVINTIAFAYGKLWFGIDNYGLYCYDNQQYKNWDTINSNLLYQTILHITPDNQGNLWLLTNKSTYTPAGYETYYKLTKFDGIQFTDTETPFSTGIYRVLKVDAKGIFWFGTSAGIYRWDGTNWENYNINNSPLSSNVVNRIDFDSKGNIWIGLNGMWDDFGHLIGGGLMKFDGNKSWQEYNVFNSPLPYNTIRALKVDKNDVVWLGTVNDGVWDGGGLTRFDGTTWQSFMKENSGISDNQVLTIDEDTIGEIWAGTLFGGLVGYDKSSKWEVFKQSNSGIALNQVSSIAIDNYDRIWMTHNVYSGGSVYNRNSLGINQPYSNREDLIQFYPNPATDYLIVENNIPNEKNFTIEIFDIQGRRLFNQIMSNTINKISLSNIWSELTSSVLIIKAMTSNSTCQGKIIMIK